MDRAEFDDALKELGINQVEAAKLLTVGQRTVRRWAEKPEEMPVAAVQALRAWRRLHRLGLPWRPDAVSLSRLSEREVADQIARHREHDVELDAVIETVKARGGPSPDWVVDLQRQRATLAPFVISFYRLQSGSFSPASYRRTDDQHPDLQQDQPMLEDGFAAIAQVLARQGWPP